LIDIGCQKIDQIILPLTQKGQIQTWTHSPTHTTFVEVKKLVKEDNEEEELPYIVSAEQFQKLGKYFVWVLGSN
jgi:hypothetical protein